VPKRRFVETLIFWEVGLMEAQRLQWKFGEFVEQFDQKVVAEFEARWPHVAELITFSIVTRVPPSF
jgi:hypothetical protein